MNEPNDNPTARVALFQKREVRRVMHNNECWFVITDIIAVLTDSANPADYWKKMRKRDPDLGKALQGGTICPPLALKFATAGGRQKLQCWNTEGLFRLVQSIPSPKAEPSQSDINITAQLKAAGEIVGIELLDHIIFNRTGYFSFLEAGKM